MHRLFVVVDKSKRNQVLSKLEGRNLSAVPEEKEPEAGSRHAVVFIEVLHDLISVVVFRVVLKPFLDSWSVVLCA